MIKQNEKYRKDGFKIFYKKWQYYNEKINNQITLELIRDEIMNTTYLLLPNEYEKNEDEKYFSEISRKELNEKDKSFENNLLLFMMLHDIREMLLINNSFFKKLNNLKLIKDNFPIENNNSELDINTEYEFQKIKSMKNFRNESISYELPEKNDFEEGELIILNKCSYFVEIINENTADPRFHASYGGVTL